MSDKGWKPRGAEEPVAMARRNRIHNAAGVVRLYNMSNRFWGTVSTVLFLSVAAVLLNRATALSGPDPLSPTGAVLVAACLFILSTCSFLCLARPHVDLLGQVATVRNPMKVYVVSLAHVREVSEGPLGYPRLQGSDRLVTVAGLQEPGRARMESGSEDIRVLKAEIEAWRACSDIGPGRHQELPDRLVISERWALVDRGLLILLSGWGLYIVSWIVL
ncbi:hypothetical protein ACFQU3_19670 [Terrabacter sp. GCM10028922]|uniref:hypothetical protein n=1 Tax=Terrabacter sp. GCM10028922 TaxID=3273428 RepID=UPI003622CC8A